MKSIIFIMTLIALVSCSSSKKSNEAFLNSKKQAKFIDNPAYNCNEQKEICASASGDSIESADLNAKQSLASSFQSQIKSKFEINTAVFSKKEKDTIVKNVNDQVLETVNIVLRSVTVKDRYRDRDKFYSQVSLNKLKAQKVLKTELMSVDDKLDYLYKQKRKSNIVQMITLYEKRQQLNERFILLSGREIKSPYTFTKINSIRYSNGPSKVNIRYPESFPSSLKSWFSSMINRSGYKIVNLASVNYKIKMSYEVKEEYLKVRGFKKYSFMVSSLAKDNVGRQIGSFNVSLASTGRTQNDAFLRIRSNLKKQIKYNLNKLNME